MLDRVPVSHARLVPCQNSHDASELVVLSSSGRSPILVDQAVDGLTACDPAGHVDRLAGFMKRRSLSARLVRTMFAVMPRVLGQDPPEVPLAEDQQVVQTLTP